MGTTSFIPESAWLRRLQRPWGLVLCCLCLCSPFLVPSAVRAATEGNSLIHFKIGDRLPPFKALPLTRREPLNFQPGAGKPAILFFFRMDPPFRERQLLQMLEALSQLAGQYREKVEILAIYSGEGEKRGLIEQLVRDQVIAIPVLDDTTRQVYRSYGVFMMPLAILISASGQLHEIIPAAGEFNELVAHNLKFLLGEWTREELQKALTPPSLLVRSTEEKEYIRRVNFGRVMYGRKMYPSAAREFLTASKIVPNPLEAYLGLGYVYVVTRKWDQALEYFRKARAIDADSDEAVAGLGLALHGKGDWRAARPLLEQALIAPEPALEVIIALAEIYESEGEVLKAVRLNKRAVSRLMERY